MSCDFKNKARYRDTYIALWCARTLAFDPDRLFEHPGKDWDRSQLLKLPLTMDSISRFLVSFSNFVLPLLAASNPGFYFFSFLMYHTMCQGNKIGMNLSKSMHPYLIWSPFESLPNLSKINPFAHGMVRYEFDEINDDDLNMK